MSRISSQSINEVKDAANIIEVIGEVVDLKKRGANHMGCCPFHNEKTPSFVVSQVKGRYKCFGCGVAGDSIEFLRKYNGLTYPDAVKKLASKYNIPLQETSELTEVERKQQDDYAAVTAMALDAYTKQLQARPDVLKFILEDRGIKLSTLIDFQIGFAPDGWSFLTPEIIKQGLHEPAKALGIVKRNEEKESNYDFFRNRWMVPIFNTRGVCLGFGGRTMSDDEKESKWLNSSESEGFFEKRNVLFGLHLAAAAIRKAGCAILVEGYMDVAGFHDKEVENTVGTMGTNFTDEEAILLKRYTNSVIIARDPDAAGLKSSLNAVDMCLKHGLKPYYLPFPEGYDPGALAKAFNTFCVATRKSTMGFTLKDYVNDHVTDAVKWKIEHIKKHAKGVTGYADSIEEIVNLIASVSNAISRDEYIAHYKKISDGVKLDKYVAKALKQRADLEAEKEQSQEGKLPPWAMKKLTELEYNGFITREDDDKKEEWGFYVRRSQSTLDKVSNFTFKFIMHIRDDDDDKRILEVNNGYIKQYVDMPSKSLVSLDQFVTAMYMLEGNMIFEGDRKQLFKLLNVLGKSCAIANELKTLGYQREGFFAYSNGIVDATGSFIAMDAYGIVKFSERNYYSPSASAIYKNRREDNDPYENDRYLKYTKAAVTFEQWAGQFAKVYQENNSGPIGIACVFIATYRDIIFRVDNNCPHLSAYGESGSGKSKYAESISNVSLNSIRPLNLFHSTDFALANRLTRYSNTIVWLDEFNDLTMKEDRFEAIKASYEGVIRERGKGGSKNKTEILKVKSFLVLTGQYLSTKDDMAAINRCIVIPFEKRMGETARTMHEIKEYDTLKNWERDGLSSIIVELLKYRNEFAEQYAESFALRFNELRTAVTAAGADYNERVLRNYNALITCWHFFSDRYKLPVNYDTFFKMIVGEIIRLSRMISTSNALADFWNTVIYLLETGEIYAGFHFKVEDHNQVTVSEGEEHGKRKSTTKTFTGMRKLLFIRLTTVQKLYSEAYRRQNGKNGLSMATLELYLNRERGFIGKSASGWFNDNNGNRTNTSSYVFDYEQLGVTLDQQVATTEEKVLTTITGRVYGEVKQVDIAGRPMLQVTHCDVSSYGFMGHPTEKKVWTKCLDPNLDNRDLYQSQQALHITGELKIVPYKDKEGNPQERRTLMVNKVAAVEEQLAIPQQPNDTGPDAPPLEDDTPF